MEGWAERAGAASAEDGCSTSALAAAAGCSVQQVRDLERLGVIPPAVRRPNGYRRFTPAHLTALRAYRRLALAVGPVAARATLREVRVLPHDEAVARILALSVGLARAREDTLAALNALDAIVGEGSRDAPGVPEDAMSITELSLALGVRTSALRFWEQQGLIAPERRPATGTRSYPPDAVREARIVAALRAGGYGLPAVQAIVASLRRVGRSEDAREALRARLRDIAARSEALLRAGTDIADLLAPDDGPTRRNRVS